MIDSVIDVYNIFNELMNTSSRLEKERILRDNCDSTLFKSVLRFVLDPMIVTGISSKKIKKDVNIGYCEIESGDYFIEDLLEYVKEHNTGTDNDIAYVQFVASKIADQSADMYDEIYEFICNIITKSLRIGVDSTTANKIYGKKFIPKLEVMLGTSIENVKLSGNEYIYISQKLNGTRCFYYKGKLYSRQGKEFTGLDHIVDDIHKLESIMNISKNEYIFDGELLLKDRSVGDSEAFQIGTGIANSKDKDKSVLQLVIFDLLPVNEFEVGRSSATYRKRKQLLEQLRTMIYSSDIHNIDIVRTFYEGYDHEQVEKWLTYAEENDMEGIMLNLDFPYECKRVRHLIKVKKFYTLDLRVIELDKGTGRNKDRLGKAYVEYKGNKVGVGSGFSDELRDYYWQHPNELVGKIIEVKYKEKTKNKDGSESLQFPVFVRIRDDKNEVSYD